MNGNKFRITDHHLDKFIEQLEPSVRIGESQTLVEILIKVTGAQPVLWTSNIIGFGSYSYKYPSGREGVSARLGFSPRKAKQSIYIMPGFGEFEDELSRLGKHKTGASCLYINKLKDVDLLVLEEILQKSWDLMNLQYPDS